jgi:hypothetical protein
MEFCVASNPWPTRDVTFIYFGAPLTSLISAAVDKQYADNTEFLLGEKIVFPLK